MARGSVRRFRVTARLTVNIVVSFILSLAAGSVLLLSGSSQAEPVAVANPSFESGGVNPDGWTLSGGVGKWVKGGCEGKRAISVTGDGEDNNYWVSEPIAFEPNAAYRLRFQVHRQDEGAFKGLAVAGPAFCNHDIGKLSDQWTSCTMLFAAPRQPDPETARLRFGQWKATGAVEFDDARLDCAWPVYRRAGGLELGDGESIHGNKYRFGAPLAKPCANISRPLAWYQCSFNSNRWCFASGGEVVYRQEVAGRRQLDAQVEVNVSYYVEGELLIEAGADGKTWREAGRISGLKSASFPIPSALLPAREVWVRLSARPRGQSNEKTDQVALQVNSYVYKATLESAKPEDESADWRGETRFVNVPEADPRLAVAIETFGDGVPGGENVLAARVANKTRQTIQARPTLVLTQNGKAPVTASCEASLAPGEQTLRLPYKVAGAGEIEARFSLGAQIKYQAETAWVVSPFYDISYGERLPGSTERLGLWWAPSGWKISRVRAMPESTGEAVFIRAARNEAEAAQLVFRPRWDMSFSAAAAGPLKGPSGATIPGERVELLRVAYVNVVHPTDATSVLGEWPDPLPPLTTAPLALKGGVNQPVWIRVAVPRGIPAGAYAGAINLSGDGGPRLEVPLRVEVYDFDLPDRMTCETAFGLEEKTIFQYHGVAGLPQQRALLDKYLKDLSAHHISPYNPASLDPFVARWPGLGEWRGEGKEIRDRQTTSTAAKPLDTAALTPVFDWTAWDAAMSRALNDYHFNTFRLRMLMLGGKHDKDINPGKIFGFPQDSKEFDLAFRAYANGLQEHLREKGWLDEAYVYWFDEPDAPHYQFVRQQLARLRDAAPDLRRTLTEQVEPGLIGGPNLWCPLTPRFDPSTAPERRKQGEHFWWYVCTGPKAPYATLFIDHPATEMRVWLWQTWQRGIEGVLVWRVNHWTQSSAYPDPERPQNPYEDAMSWGPKVGADGAVQRFGNGDGRFIYPPAQCADGHPSQPFIAGPVDSIRWEMLRDGVEDYEYLAMLKRSLAEHGAQLPPNERTRYEALLAVPDSITKSLTDFTKDPAPIEARRDAIARALAALRAR